MRYDFEIQPKALPLISEKARFKVLYGGRGSCKSWSIARALICMALQRRRRILCCREFQNSIKESVLSLIKNQIDALEMSKHFIIGKYTIRCLNGSEFLFAGLRHNVQSIKSMESLDIAWIEEAQKVSRDSIEILTPTVRNADSEIWISFNPELETDEVYRRFIARDELQDAIVINMSWKDNRWWNDAMEKDRTDLLARDPARYANVWDGQVERFKNGAIYAAELEAAYNDNRICNVPYDPMLPVYTAWDLGMLSSTAIWFAQVIRGGEVRLIDYYEASGEGFAHYASVLQQRGYVYDAHYAPHDISVREIGTGKSRLEMAFGLGISFTTAPRYSLEDGINAVRALFPRIYIDKVRCAPGINSLARYVRAYNARMGEFTATPVTDQASHGADALRYLAISITDAQITRSTDNYITSWLS